MGYDADASLHSPGAAARPGVPGLGLHKDALLQEYVEGGNGGVGEMTMEDEHEVLREAASREAVCEATLEGGVCISGILSAVHEASMVIKQGSSRTWIPMSRIVKIWVLGPEYEVEAEIPKEG